MKRTCVRIVLGAGLVAGLTAGCSREGTEPVAASREAAEQAPAPQIDVLGDLMSSVQEKLEVGNTNAAIAELDAALSDPVYEAVADEVCRALLQQVLAGGDTEAACSKFLSVAAANVRAAQGSMLMMHEELVRQGQIGALINWCDEIIAAELPEAMKGPAHLWKIESCLTTAQTDRGKAAIADCAAGLSEDMSKRVIAALLANGLSRGQEPMITTVFDAVEALPSADRYRDVVARARIQLLVVKARWSELPDAVQANKAVIGDRDLAGLLSYMASRATRAGEFATVDAVCSPIVETADPTSAAGRQAAIQWVGSAAGRHQAGEVVRRIEALEKRGYPSAVVSPLIRRHFYLPMQGGDIEAQTKMLGFVKHELAQAQDEKERAMLEPMALDGAVILEDYTYASEVLNAGFKDRDEEWRSMAINKIEAHAALKDGRIEEAIRRFRSFMAVAQTWEESTPDPTTGINHTRDMTLGRNAKRIGDLYASINKHAEAAAAYEEARGYYEDAQRECEQGSKEAALIRDEMAAIPVATVAEQEDEK